MKDFLIALAAHPQLPSFVLGVFVPRLYTFLQTQGKEIPTGQKYAFNIVLCIAVSLIPIYAMWYVHGLPSPEEFLSALSAAALASEGAYRLYFKPRAEAQS